MLTFLALLGGAGMADEEGVSACLASASVSIHTSKGVVAQLNIGGSGEEDEEVAWQKVREHSLWGGGGCGNTACVVSTVVDTLRRARTSIAALVTVPPEAPLRVWVESAVVSGRSHRLNIRGEIDTKYAVGLDALGARVELSSESGVVGTTPARRAFSVDLEAVGAGPGSRVLKAQLTAPGAPPACTRLVARVTAEARWFARDYATMAYWPSARREIRIGAVGYPVNVSIGRGTYGTEGLRLWGYGDGAAIKIGNFSSIGPECAVLLGGNHRFDWTTTYPFPAFHPDAMSLVDSGRTRGPHATSKGDVIIGSDVWIGFGVTILSGVAIGNGAVLGARTVVAKDVPPYAIVVGNPARLIRFRFDNNTIASLLQHQWWKWPDDDIIQRFPSLLRPPQDLDLLR